MGEKNGAFPVDKTENAFCHKKNVNQYDKNITINEGGDDTWFGTVRHKKHNLIQFPTVKN